MIKGKTINLKLRVMAFNLVNNKEGHVKATLSIDIPYIYTLFIKNIIVKLS